jgi:hypothetical protein
MPHYMDGSPAKIGDMVVGKGYNVPGNITGVVVGIVPDSESCNIRVAHILYREVPADYKPTDGERVYTHTYGQPGIALKIDIEYGETKQFIEATQVFMQPAEITDLTILPKIEKLQRD